MTTTATTSGTPTKTRRSDGLVGNALVLFAVVLFLCEFVGIIGTGIHPMPTVPGAATPTLTSTYRGQEGVTGFMVGWYALVLPGRILIALAVRQSVLASTPERFGSTWRTLLHWSVGLMTLGVAAELGEVVLNAGTAAAAAHGASTDLVFALDRVSHYFLAAVYGPNAMAGLIIGLVMWRSGVFPRILAGLLAALSAVSVVSSALLSSPSTAGVQDAMSISGLLVFVLLLWLGVLVLVRRPRAASVRG